MTIKNTILTLSLILSTFSICGAQQIKSEKVFGRYNFTQNEKNLNMGELVHMMESNEEAYKLIKQARSKSTFASIFGFAGGGFIGWSMGAAVRDEEIDWTLTGIGVGLVVIAIPISVRANKKAKQAVDTYNSSMNSTSYHEFNPEFEIIANGNGIGLTMKF